MNSVEKGTTYIIASRFVFFLTGYIIYFILARFLLTPEQFGVYGLIIALFTTVNMVLVTTLNQAVSKFVSEKEHLAEVIKRKALKLQIGFSLIIFAAYFALAPFIAFALNDMTLVPLIQFSGLLFISHPLFSIFGGCLTGLRQFKGFAWLEISYSVMKMLLVIGFVLLGFEIFGAIGGFVAASFLAVAIGFLLTKSKKSAGSFDSKKLISFAWPLLFLAIIQSLLLYIDLFAVKSWSYVNADLLSGYYVAAQTIARLPQFLIFAIVFVMFPLISSTTFKKQDKKAKFYLSNAIRYTVLFIAPVTVIIAANSGPIISLLYSAIYLPGASALSILAFSSAFYALFLILTTAISSRGESRVSMYCGGIALLSLFVSLAILVPSYSIEGAAIASLIASFIGMILAAGYVLYKFGVLIPAKSFAKILAASTITFFISFVMPATGFLLIAKLLFLLLIYCLALVALRELDKRDFAVFLKMLR